MKTCRIPLTRAAVCQAIVLAARQYGAPVQKISEVARFPLHVLEQPEQMVPQLPARRFAEIISHREGDPLFGFRMAQTLPFQEITTVTPLLKDCPNLFCLLKRFCDTVHLQSDLCHFVLNEEDDFVWMAQVHLPGPDDNGQIELFELAGMIHLVRIVAGENWRPSLIHLRSAWSLHLANAAELNPSQIHFSRPWTAIAIPRNLLGLPIPLAENARNNSTLTLAEFPETIRERLRATMSPYLGMEKLNQKLASDITGMSFRTLQRLLAQNKTSYAQIIAQMRFQKAEGLLKESDECILNICLQLGYENAPSFTRAFRRWSGMSPSEYRKSYRPAH